MKYKLSRYIAVLVLILLMNSTVQADDFYTDIYRISGENRYITAVKLSKENYKNSNTVILASGEAFADAISSSQLARNLRSPILLTNQKEMPTETLNEIKRLKPKKVIVIGGYETVNEEQLSSLDVEIERISGSDRYETSEKILLKLQALYDLDSQMVLVSGKNFQNIVSANQIAISKKIPMLLVGDNLPLRYYGRQFIQVGELDMDSSPIEKITGINPYEISAKCFAMYNNEDLKLTLCNGENYTDAMLAASEESNVLLTNQNYVNVYALDFLKNYNFSKVQILGGEESIEESVMHQIYGLDNKNIKNTKLPDKMTENHEGDIMVLMYHDLNYYNDRYRRTEGAIRADIINLYNRGYLPISIEDYYNNNIDIKEGYTPYVLTFDDGTPSKIALNRDGSLNKICAFSVLKELEKELPNFNAKATIFVSSKYPFGQVDFISQKLYMIIESGMIVGNHTLTHEDFSKHPDKIEEEIALQKHNLESYINTDYNINIFSIPYSVSLSEDEHQRVKKGEHNGINYENKIILGGVPNPTLAPGRFNQEKYIIPRISVPGVATDRKFYDYIKYYDENPDKRYVK
ncbi:cell wall-binding repeat-containing protein [Microaceticoccus formicicus]|uniref:cell wall-binding repeat-containing protein n=1 Tax=Microaceticoccus formicicus TaxID=3118105 RepID=UPI003CD0157C|nr:cell wall-binding repeat-containing protein [Peptoniphilaceae bacterium AMB_02]